MFQSDVGRDYTNEDAAFGLRYALGCAIELTIAVWLLVHGENLGPVSTWLAYGLLAQTTACLMFGFWWYGCWAYERYATHWYLAGVASLIGATCVALNSLFSLGFQGWDIALSFSLLYFAATHGVWRLARYFVVRTFSILLLGVSQVGAAWRGGEPHR
jgi:hypothetical protein